MLKNLFKRGNTSNKQEKKNTLGAFWAKPVKFGTGVLLITIAIGVFIYTVGPTVAFATGHISSEQYQALVESFYGIIPSINLPLK